MRLKWVFPTWGCPMDNKVFHCIDLANITDLNPTDLQVCANIYLYIFSKYIYEVKHLVAYARRPLVHQFDRLDSVVK